MVTPRFRVSYKERSRTGRWFLIPQASREIFLTCPACNHLYKLQHKYCGLSISLEEALKRHRCDFCLSNGQVGLAALPIDIADCPKCGKQCRTMGDAC